MNPPEDVLAQTERHIREGEVRIARQRLLIRELEQQGHQHELAMARELLTTFEMVQDLAHDHLRLERRKRGLKP